MRRFVVLRRPAAGLAFTLVVALGFAMTLGVSSAGAQEVPRAGGQELPRAGAQELPRASVSVLGGGTLPLAQAADAMGIGWNVGVAGSVAVAGGVGLRADYLYHRFGAKTATWDVTGEADGVEPMNVRAKSQMHAVSLNVTWTEALEQGRRVYLMAGPTFFRRRVQLSGDDIRGTTRACEVQWLQCAAGPVGVDRALGIKKEDDLGFNVGAGFAFRAGLNALLTVEARYYYVRGPIFQAADGGTRRASARFVPVSVGLSF